MKDLLDKITSYNLYNYLFPGVIFVVLAQTLTSFSLIQENLIIGAFVYYFIGLVISRIGSLIVEPILKKTNFVKFIACDKFNEAYKKDQKLEILSEANNSYRTISSMLILLLILKLYDFLAFVIRIQQDTSEIFLVLILLIVFLFSYKKQTKYIVDRVGK